MKAKSEKKSPKPRSNADALAALRFVSDECERHSIPDDPAAAFVAQIKGIVQEALAKAE